MPNPATVPSPEFARDFPHYRERAALGEIIKVTDRNRVVGAYLSAAGLGRYERLKRRERESLVFGEWPEDVVADIERAEYDRAA